MAPGRNGRATAFRIAGLLIAAGLMLVAVGCRRPEAGPAAGTAEQPPASNRVDLAGTEPSGGESVSPASALSGAQGLVQSGRVDEAAARLVKLQLESAQFDAQQAKDYRRVMSEAYDRALEAMQRGDPRGRAALELLRAAGPR